METLQEIARAMVAPGKGILAADESPGTATKRLNSINVESTPDSRCQYRKVFLGTEGIGDYLSGVIFHDETFRQNISDGISFVELLKGLGVIPGIKVDMGLQDLPNFPGEKYTQGIDGLRARLAEYYEMGARFAKWRTVFSIGGGLPSEVCLNRNCDGMALYASLCQEAGIVPIVEPEVLLDGTHTIEESYEVTTRVLKALFAALKEYKVQIDGVILKSSMVISGKDNDNRADAATVGELTIKCLKESLPDELPGVVFLSGGQTAEEATENLCEVNKAAEDIGGVPWQLTFSYARALQGPSLKVWNGVDENIPAAREKFVERMKANSAARMGQAV